MGANLGDVSRGDSGGKTSHRLKIFFLSVVYFLIIAAYTILRDLKNSVFMGIVGRDYIPWAKVSVLFILIPAILFYSTLVDRIRRYRLLMWYSLFYACVALVIAFFVGHSTIGITNTNQSPDRLFGWIFYFLVEGFSPFVLSVYWAFLNSVSKPEEAKNNYALLVGGSKLGGMLSAGFAWALLSNKLPLVSSFSDVGKIQLILVAVSVLLFLIPLAIRLLMRHVAGYHLHGYEAVYRVEKQRSKEGKAKTGIFAGLKMFLKYPYVLGIFGMVFFYETLATILSYLRLDVAQSSGQSIVEVSVFLFKWVFIMQVSGFVFTLLGTRTILRRFGPRISLLLVPTFMAFGSLFFFATNVTRLVMIGYIITKTTHYAFGYPVREMLYIPTLKEIKFKSKSWIDAFGSRLAKSTGSTINIMATRLGATMFYPFMAGVFALFLGVWFFMTFLLGIRYERAVKNNEVIGLNGSGDDEKADE